MGQYAGAEGPAGLGIDKSYYDNDRTKEGGKQRA